MPWGEPGLLGKAIGLKMLAAWQLAFCIFNMSFSQEQRS